MWYVYSLNHVWLLATPSTVAHQAPQSMGLSRHEYWSGLPFLSPMHENEKWKWSRSVMSDPQLPHGLQPTRLLSPWDFPGRSTGVGCHCLLQLSLDAFYQVKQVLFHLYPVESVKPVKDFEFGPTKTTKAWWVSCIVKCKLVLSSGMQLTAVCGRWAVPAHTCKFISVFICLYMCVCCSNFPLN